jgi:hypothetical protein
VLTVTIERVIGKRVCRQREMLTAKRLLRIEGELHRLLRLNGCHLSSKNRSHRGCSRMWRIVRRSKSRRKVGMIGILVSSA